MMMMMMMMTMMMMMMIMLKIKGTMEDSLDMDQAASHYWNLCSLWGYS